MINTNQLYREVTHCLCSELEIEKAVFSCLTLLRQHIPVDHLGVQVYEPSLGSMRILAVAREASSQQLDRLIPLPTPGKRQLDNDVPENDRPLVINRPAENVIVSGLVNAMGMDPTPFRSWSCES